MAPSTRETRAGGFHRVLVMAAVLLGATALMYVLPIRHWLDDTDQLRAALASTGIWIYPVATIGIAALVACGIPRLLLCAIAGILFGFGWGLLLGQIGTLIGYYAVFIFVRWGGRDWALRRWPALRKWAELAHEEGLMAIILFRQLPIPGNVINVALGLSHVKHRHFILGTLIGTLPESTPATLIGAGLVKGSLKAMTGYLALAALVLTIVGVGSGYWLRAMRKSRAGAVIMTEADSLKEVE
jgi:uncharacterized membrane protein YdjX (TVP38/TMEM64 family)